MTRKLDPEASVLKAGTEKEQLAKFLREEKVKEQGQTLSVLDSLRRSRKSRGGTGAPLQVPSHLSAGSQIIVTDADLNADFTKD